MAEIGHCLLNIWQELAFEPMDMARFSAEAGGVRSAGR